MKTGVTAVVLVACMILCCLFALIDAIGHLIDLLLDAVGG